MKLKLYFCGIRNKTTCLNSKKIVMKKEITIGEKIAKYITKKATETYKLYVRNDISTDGLSKEEWVERETRRILDSIKWNLNNIK